MADTHPQASSFESLLNESRDLVCEQLLAAVKAMLEKADESLAALSSETQSREAQELYQQTRKVLASGRDGLEREFHKAYLNEFRKHTSLIREEAQSFSELDTSLQLVGEDDLEETLKFKEVAAKLRRYCDEELAALDQRVGVLLGDANLSAENNPFGPETIGDAWQEACRTLDANAKVRGVLLRLFDDHVVDQVRSIYKAVNALLVKNSILPKIRYGVAKKGDGKRPPGAAKDEDGGDEDAAKEGDAEANEKNLFSLLQKLVGGGAGGAGAVLPPGAVILQGAELLGSLTKLQQGDASVIPGGLSAAAASGTTNVLHELKASSFGAGLVQMDATTLDIVAMLFDQLFDDPNIPAGLKGLIGRLQIPMLKVAIADKTFFANKKHPARLLLDSFGEMATRLPPEFNTEDPTFVHLEAMIQHLLDNFQDDVGIFDSVRAQIQGIAAEHDKHIEEQAQAVAVRIEQTENLAVAKTAAEDEVKVRLQAHSVPGPVLEFIVEQWLKLLLLIHAKSGAGSENWKRAVDAMDDLIWSVEPKKTADDRRKLAAKVPNLVKTLVSGLDAIGAPPEVRESFFAELMRYHTAALNPPKGQAEAPAPAKPVAPDFTEAVTVRNPYGAGEIQVTGLDFVAQPADPDKRESAKAALRSSLAVPPPENMEIGTWVEFRPKDAAEEQRAAKLLFVSPKKTRYLFSDRRGKNILELTRAEIVRRLRTGEAVRLEEEPVEPLFDRIMGGLMQKVRTPAAATT
ncbi:MAG TPA: DUF1631 family protein [Burkholderiales bacterium]